MLPSALWHLESGVRAVSGTDHRRPCHSFKMEGRPDPELPVVRIGDAEREAVLDALGEHHAKGRLTVEELDRRQRAALTAESQKDLAGLLADLPEIAPPHASSASESSSRRLKLSQREEIHALVRWAPPAVVTTAAATWVATSGPFPDDSSQFVMAMGMAVVGFISSWWVSKRRDD